MAAHRYWRLYFVANQYGHAAYVGIAELELRSVAGGSNLAVTEGNAASSGNYSGTYLPAKAIDGSTATNNGWVSQSSVYPAWWSYDLGVGNEAEIVEVVLKSRTDSYEAQPFGGRLDYSDDNTNWTPAGYFGCDRWTNGMTQVLTPAALAGMTWPPEARQHQGNVTGSRIGIDLGPGARMHVNSNRHVRQVFFGGNYHIAGSTTVLGDPEARRVDLLTHRGRIVDSQHTREDGTFDFRDIGPGPWTVLGSDNRREQNSVVWAHVNAAEQ